MLGGLAISVFYKRYEYKKSPSLVVNCYKAAVLATKVSLYSLRTNVLLRRGGPDPTPTRKLSDHRLSTTSGSFYTRAHYIYLCLTPSLSERI